jgi:nucleoside-diphosphate-sugar epimerase
MKVFVAGATGVLGRVLVPQLLAAGHDLRAIARRVPTGVQPAGVEFIEANLLSDDLVECVSGCDAVVHIATAIPHDPSAQGAWDGTAQLRTVGTRRLLDAALACGVRRYLQQSIVMAYRDGGDAWLDETAPLDESADRAAICQPVLAMEKMVREVQRERLVSTILRGGSFVGAGTGEIGLVERLKDGELVVAGDGSNYVSPVNVSDMASALVAALLHAPAGSTFNIVDQPLRYRDYVDAVADMIGASRPRRKAELLLPPSWRCTNQAAKTVLGWIPRGRIWPDVNDLARNIA